MGLFQIKMEKWFDHSKKDSSELNLNKSQLKAIRKGDKIVAKTSQKAYLLYLREGYNLSSLTVDDLIVQEVPLDFKNAG